MSQYVLGINLSHDRSTCLLKDGKVAVAIEEERLDRIKHSIGRMLHDHARQLGPKLIPWRGITYCLDYCGIGIEDVDLIMLDQAGPAVLLNEIAKEIPIKDKSKIRSIPHPSHHLAHAYSSYFCSPFKESAILVTDNIGSYLTLAEENEGETGYHAQDLKVSEIFKTTSKARDLESDSLCLGRLYRMGTLLLGFYHEKIAAGYLGYLIQYLDDAGKTMGLAPYGKKRKDWPPFLTIKNGEPDYSNFVSWLKKQKLFPHKKIKDVSNNFEYLIRQLNFRDSKKNLTSFDKDLAYAIQHYVEKGLIYLANNLYEKTKSDNLCIAGGVGLNSVANKKILDKTPFKNVFIQPGATDDGNAIGAAYYGWYHYLEGKARFCMRHASLGKSYSDEEIESALIQNGIVDFEKLDEPALLDFVAESLKESKIIGWFQGASEFGPRALGYRSILADPRHPKMKDVLNQRVKFRESFRPYAPSILQEHAQEYFDISCESPFMLLVAPVKKGKRKLIPAVTHVDGTARLQTVNQEDHALFYSLIRRFYEKTDVPILLNTSFNIKGEPIVETPVDAILCFLKTDMDYLVMGSYVVKKELFSDDLMQELIPFSLVKVVSDENKKKRHFYVDIFKQVIINLTQEEKVFIDHCKNGMSATQIIDELRIKYPQWEENIGMKPHDFIRLLFRRRIVSLKTAFSDVIFSEVPSQDF